MKCLILKVYSFLFQKTNLFMFQIKNRNVNIMFIIGSSQESSEIIERKTRQAVNGGVKEGVRERRTVRERAGRWRWCGAGREATQKSQWLQHDKSSFCFSHLHRVYCFSYGASIAIGTDMSKAGEDQAGKSNPAVNCFYIHSFNLLP